jgi:hypothetical protein
VDGVNNIGTPTTHLLQGVPTLRTIAILHFSKQNFRCKTLLGGHKKVAH